jgi:hypothetical protein
MATEPRDPLRTYLVKRYGSYFYNQLYDAGANLSYIGFLDAWLSAADVSVGLTRRPGGQAARARRSRERKKRDAEMRNQLASMALSVFQSYLTGWLESARALNPAEPLLNPKHPQFDSRLQEISSRVMPRIINQLHDQMIDAAPRFKVDQDNLAQQESALEKVLREYLPTPGRYTKGGREDLRGSFLLTAVTEHLGEARGRYRLAGQLLAKIRSSDFKTGRRSQTGIGELTRLRVQRFKKLHPNWQTHLTLIAEHWRTRAGT